MEHVCVIIFTIHLFFNPLSKTVQENHLSINMQKCFNITFHTSTIKIKIVHKNIVFYITSTLILKWIDLGVSKI